MRTTVENQNGAMDFQTNSSSLNIKMVSSFRGDIVFSLDKDTKISSFLYLLNELISSEKDCKIFDIMSRMD